MSSETPERQVDQVIRIGHPEPGTNALLQGLLSEETSWTRHFNENEEFFVELEGEVAVPSLPIHHDVRNPLPGAEYAASVREVVRQLVQLAPAMFKGLTYTFAPADVLRAHFHRLDALEGRTYLYRLAVDLTFRGREHSATARGTNDRTAAYRGRRVFVEGLFVPVASAGAAQGPTELSVLQSFSRTFLGERGRGYFRQGIWIDQDLTKFFSKLFLPAGLRAYPYFPFVCRYRTLCEAIIDLAASARAARLPFLHRALDFISPVLGRIERELRGTGFSEDLPFFKELKRSLPPVWEAFCRGLGVRAYLNPAGMKEFVVESSND